MTVPFSSSTQNSTFHLISDNSTAISLVKSIADACSSNLNSNSTGSQSITAYDPNSNNTSNPKPEEAVQYYRASSIVLTLDGYNDTTALSQNASTNTVDTPLPSWVDLNLLSCLNSTIGESAPLVDAQEAIASAAHDIPIPVTLWLLIGAVLAAQF